MGVGLVLLRKDPFLRFTDYVEVARVLRVCALAATTFLLTLSSVTSALGHPHMWVDLESRVVLNNDAGTVAIQQVWLFDDFFSTSVIEDASLDPGGTNAGIQKEIGRITEALKPYNLLHQNRNGGQKFIFHVNW